MNYYVVSSGSLAHGSGLIFWAIDFLVMNSNDEPMAGFRNKADADEWAARKNEESKPKSQLLRE